MQANMRAGTVNRKPGRIDADLTVTGLDVRAGAITTGTARAVLAFADSNPQAFRRTIKFGEQPFDFTHPRGCRLDHQVTSHSGNGTITADKGLNHRQDFFVAKLMQLNHFNGIIRQHRVDTGDTEQRRA